MSRCVPRTPRAVICRGTCFSTEGPTEPGRSIQFLDIGFGVCRRPILADFGDAAVLTHALVLLNFSESDFTDEFVGGGHHHTFAILFLYRFVDLDLVALGEAVLGAEGNPNFFAIHEGDSAFYIPQSGFSLRGGGLIGSLPRPGPEIKDFHFFNDLINGFDRGLAQSAVHELPVVIETAAVPGAEIEAGAVLDSQRLAGSAGNDFARG